MQKFVVELSISMADGGRTAMDILEMYSTQVVDDINQTAWNLCDCEQQVQDQKFGGLKLDRWVVNDSNNGGYQVNATMQVTAENREFAQQVIEEYMDGFADWISVIENGMYSRTGVRNSFNPHPLEWNVDIV